MKAPDFWTCPNCGKLHPINGIDAAQTVCDCFLPKERNIKEEMMDCYQYGNVPATIADMVKEVDTTLDMCYVTLYHRQTLQDRIALDRRTLAKFAKILECAKDWVDAIDRNGSSWDDWDYYYKKMKYELLPELKK